MEELICENLMPFYAIKKIVDDCDPALKSLRKYGQALDEQADIPEGIEFKNHNEIGFEKTTGNIMYSNKTSKYDTATGASKVVSFETGRSGSSSSNAAQSATMSQRMNTTPDIQDHELWAAKMQAIAQNQDRQAFAELFEFFSPRIKSFVMNGNDSVINNELAEEIVQEVMIKVWRKANSYNAEKARVSTWIYTIARNCRIDLLRKHNSKVYSLDTEDIWVEQISDETPVVSLQQQRTQAFIHEKLAELPDEQQHVLRKVYMEGKSHSEIANELGLPLGTVKSRVRLAMKKLSLMIDR